MKDTYGAKHPQEKLHLYNCGNTLLNCCFYVLCAMLLYVTTFNGGGHIGGLPRYKGI